ncbi:hypothetical protein MBLNU13_g03541t1 [Cladosporium sp. NU13]
MARRGRFHMLPADNTFDVEDFDMFLNMSKATKPRRVSQNDSSEATSAVHRVFNTTELVEMILLDENLRMEQLFVLQRVSKRLQHVIEGSQNLQVKMFGLLACTSQNANVSFKEKFEQSTEDDGPALLNPLMGIPRTNARLQLPLFRDFDFSLEQEEDRRGRTQLLLRSVEPLGGAAEKKLRPRLGGPWSKMAIAKIPLTLRVQVDSHYLERLSLKGEDAAMGKLVDILSLWYNDKRQRRGHRYKTVPAARYRDGLTLLID